MSLIGIFSITNVVAKQSLNVYLSDQTNPPSHFETSGDIHSTFNACVRGQLLKRTKGFKLAPGLIEKYYYDIKSNSYILKLKDNLFFHHGRKATSKDLEFSLLRGFFSTRANFFSTRFGNILGVKGIKPGTKYKSGMVKGVKIIDELTISVKLENPNPSFFHNLSSAYYSLIPIEKLKDDYLTWNGVPVGVGEYRVEKESVVEKITILSKGSGDTKKIIKMHWGDKVPIETDISINPIKDFNISYSTYPVSIRILEFSNLNELSKYKEFRQAVNLVLDRKLFSNPQLGLTPLNEVLPQHFWGRTHAENPYSLEKAKILIGKIPKKLREKKYISLIYSGKKLSKNQIFYKNIIEKSLQQIGINIEFQPYQKKFISKESAIKAPMMLSGKIVDYVDPLVMFGTYRRSENERYLKAQGADIDPFQKLYDKAAHVKSLADRVESVKELNHFTVKNAIVVSLAEEKMVYYTNPKSVKSLGEQFEPMTLFLDRVELKD